MSKTNLVLSSVASGVATITLDNADSANSLSLALATELAAAAIRCDNDPSVKAVILAANGRLFCAGGDVNSMQQGPGTPGQTVKAIADKLHQAISVFSRMSAPIIAAVNGTAAGAGFSLAVACDLVLASKDAKFTMAYSKIGLSPDGSASYFLPRLIGLRKTQELMFTNRVLSAEEALTWGLVNRVCEPDDLMNQANALAGELASGSLGSNAAIKQLLLSSASQGLETQMELESRTIAKCANSPDGREGVAAFIEKRKPKFSS